MTIRRRAIVLKYIVIKDRKGYEIGFLFDSVITHFDFYQGVQQTPIGHFASQGRNWERELRESTVISAGFFNGQECLGSSESLKIKSRGEKDTELFLGEIINAPVQEISV